MMECSAVRRVFVNASKGALCLFPFVCLPSHEDDDDDDDDRRDDAGKAGRRKGEHVSCAPRGRRKAHLARRRGKGGRVKYFTCNS